MEREQAEFDRQRERPEAQRNSWRTNGDDRDKFGLVIEVPQSQAPLRRDDRNRQLEEEVNALRKELYCVRVNADMERKKQQNRLFALERHAASPHTPKGPPAAPFPQHASILNFPGGVRVAVDASATR